MKKVFFSFLTFMMLAVIVFSTPPTMAAEAADMSGTYYIKNLGTALFVDAISTVSGTAVTVQNSDPYRRQRWIVTSRTGGYSIQHAGSGYYLTVYNNSSASGTSVVLMPYTGSSGQLWTFASMNGGYRLVPNCASNLVLGTTRAATSMTAGAQLKIISYTHDAYNYDLWEMKKISYTVVVDADKDASYINRYGTSTANSRIDACLDALKLRLLLAANIEMVTSSTFDTTTLHIDADNCAGQSSVTAVCACGTCENSTANSDKDYHHTNMYNNLYKIDGVTGAIRVIFSGHEMCYAMNTTHIANSSGAGYFNLNLKSENAVLIKDFKTEANHEVMMAVRAVLQLYGLNDHDTVTGGYSNDCIFGSSANSSDVRVDCTLCSGCIAALQANADEYNHGN